MPTLLLQLIGPMQSWGTTSRFTQRDTGKEPSKSGVIGLIAAAMGIDRKNWTDLEPLTRLTMAVRHDRPGTLKTDYQTAGCAADDKVMKANGTLSDDGVVSQRQYLADAAFLVGLESSDDSLLGKIQASLQNPFWPLSLGRKSYVPSEPVCIQNGPLSVSLRRAMEQWPWIANCQPWEKFPEKLLASFESKDGTGLMKMDQPLSSFEDRRFGARFVHSEWIPFPEEAAHVS